MDVESRICRRLGESTYIFDQSFGGSIHSVWRLHPPRLEPPFGSFGGAKWVEWGRGSFRRFGAILLYKKVKYVIFS